MGQIRYLGVLLPSRDHFFICDSLFIKNIPTPCAAEGKQCKHKQTETMNNLTFSRGLHNPC